MYRKVIGAVALALAVVSLDPAVAQRSRSGVLDCDVSGGFGWIIGSQKSVACLYTPDRPGPPQETYTGTITKFGLDIGATSAGRMVWGVFIETTAGRGALAGDYVGATGEATVAVGLGGNVLVGGSGRTVALQPLSVTGQSGLNLAVGVADLHLRPGR
jgi:Protein of unknown function (DUF992)